ncbi:MAG: DUF1345 domain-containing protein [Polyangiaceae bacterium]
MTRDTLARNGARPPRLSPWRLETATSRLAFAVIIGVLAMLASPDRVGISIRSAVGWDAAAAAYIVVAWWTILRFDAERTRRRAAAEDPGRTLVFVIALAASAFSLFAATVVLREIGGFERNERLFWSVLALLAVVLSWVLTHTVYGLRYAHLHYRGKHVGGLRFPGDHDPTEVDFAYFSFTLGMCFQVSDVSIESSRIRRTVLGHALLSFVYNTTILALALNLVFGWLAPR